MPDITPILARYGSESARMRARLPCRLAVPYGASEPKRLDIFPSATSELSPIFVFIHGGYWRLLDSPQFVVSQANLVRHCRAIHEAVMKS